MEDKGMAGVHRPHARGGMEDKGVAGGGQEEEEEEQQQW